MRLRLTGMGLCGLLLAGCGGSDKAAEAEATGVLQASGATGVHYSTPTRTGTTDAAGTFKYLPGETVSFSVAGVELGAVPGAPSISLFTLAGLTPPTTEPALRRELDRARRLGTPFTRAINSMRLLMVLDADGNPATGIDVRGREDLLTAGTADLGLKVREFAAQLEQTSPRLTRNIPVWLPVAQLYRSVAIAVAAHGITRTDANSNWGLLPAAYFNSYDSQGVLIGEDIDQTGDGAPESSYRYTYDPMYRLLEFHGVSGTTFDARPQETRASYSYNSSGNATQVHDEIDVDGDGAVDRRSLQELSFDAVGDLTRSVSSDDTDANGVIDARGEWVSTYDSHHNVLTGTLNSDDDNDGHIDSRLTNVSTYDGQDHLIRRVNEEDIGVDGTIDSRYVEEFSYTPEGRVARLVATADYDFPQGADYITIYTWTYDRDGNAVTSTIEADNDADGVINQRSTTSNTYDHDKRKLTEVLDYDVNGDGIVEQRTRLLNVFDTNGNLQSSTWENNALVDPEFELRGRTVYEYGPAGEPIEYVSESSYDEDGVPQFRSSTRYTTTQFADGVLMLAREYAQSGGAAADGGAVGF